MFKYVLIFLFAVPWVASAAPGETYICSGPPGPVCNIMSPTNPIPFVPGSVTIVALDIASVTTGGTPVNALSAGNAAHGGVLITANAAGICVNEKGAAGTATSGDTICVAQNQKYTIAPTTNAISVNSSASSVTLAGNGYK